ncbi:hypothetical protein [Actinophytocola sp.]|uniref:hypothetical protein n=1 Tax=Actinophytocola sp. TaxID=1872138 RepID=UPI00389A9D53
MDGRLRRYYRVTDPGEARLSAEVEKLQAHTNLPNAPVWESWFVVAVLSLARLRRTFWCGSGLLRRAPGIGRSPRRLVRHTAAAHEPNR